MLELTALIQLVLTCWGFLHAIALPVSYFQVSIGIEPLATSYHYLLTGLLLYSMFASHDGLEMALIQLICKILHHLD